MLIFAVVACRSAKVRSSIGTIVDSGFDAAKGGDASMGADVASAVVEQAKAEAKQQKVRISCPCPAVMALHDSQRV